MRRISVAFIPSRDLLASYVKSCARSSKYAGACSVVTKASSGTIERFVMLITKAKFFLKNWLLFPDPQSINPSSRSKQVSDRYLKLEKRAFGPGDGVTIYFYRAAPIV